VDFFGRKKTPIKGHLAEGYRIELSTLRLEYLSKVLSFQSNNPLYYKLIKANPILTQGYFLKAKAL